MILSRRNLLRGIGLTIAAPAIVRIDSLMKLPAPRPMDWEKWGLPKPTWRMCVWIGDSQGRTIRSLDDIRAMNEGTKILDRFATLDAALMKEPLFPTATEHRYREREAFAKLNAALLTPPREP